MPQERQEPTDNAPPGVDTPGVRGFILHPSCRVRSGKPVVVLFGVLESGETFVVQDNRTTPHFYVDAAHEERALAAGASAVHASSRHSMTGEPVVRVDTSIPQDAPTVRDRLHDEGLTTYEADVRFAMRYLIDRDIRGSLQIEGRPRQGKRIDRDFVNPIVHPGDWAPKLRVLSLDIETDPKIQHVLSIGLWGNGRREQDVAEVLLLTPGERTSPEGAVPAPTEKDLLRLLAARIRAIDPDVIIGWNVADFDFEVLLRRADALEVDFEIGRAPGRVVIRRGRDRRQATQVVIPGRVVLDGPTLLRGSFIQTERMGLDAVARQFLGEGKSLTGHDRAGAILQMFRDDREAFVEYNLRDARLALQILEHQGLIELSVERSRVTGMPIDRVSASVASFDFLYLAELHRRRLVAPSVGDPNGADRIDFEPMAGGHLLEPVTGLHENVMLLDFKSLYPSLMRTFQIDPLGHLSASESESPIIAPNGAAFRREPGILTGMLDDLFPRRDEARSSGNTSASMAIKILMNSFYGVLGTTSCRFFDPDLANAITSFGKAMLLWSRDWFEARGLRVLYGDTDSLFVLSNGPASETRALGERLAGELTSDLAEHIESTWGVESKLELEFERLYLRLFLPTTRDGSEGAMKRYAGLAETANGEEVVFTGLEAVRRDWTTLARRAQRALYERLFREQPIEHYLTDLVARLRGGDLDNLLVYRKAMRKDESEYTTTTPPHVAAARKMTTKPGRVISYVVTVAGPEPADERVNEFDYEHYLDKQIRPIAEPVLEVLGLEFKRVIGDDRQMDLF